MKWGKYTVVIAPFLLFTNFAAASEATLESLSETYCIQAQSILGSYRTDDIIPLVNFTLHENVESFIQSKPKIENGLIRLHGYKPTIAQAHSEYEQLWCKLKSADDIRKSSLELPPQEGQYNCDSVNQFFFDQVISSSEELKKAYDQSGISITFKNKSYYTGAQWAPSYPTIKLLSPKSLEIITTSLESLSGIPVIGGMNYCKFVAPEGIKQLIKDLSQKPSPELDKITLSLSSLPRSLRDQNLIYQSVNIHTDQSIIPRNADIYWPNSAPKGIFIISPGGGIHPLDMRSIAKAIAREGHGVIVVEYPANLAVFEKIIGRENSAYLYASIIKNKETYRIKNLNPQITADLNNLNIPIRLLGHSLGGAVMGDSIFGEQTIFDQIILYGTLSFIQSGDSDEFTAPNIKILFGLQDGLSFSDKNSFRDFLKRYHFEEISEGKEYQIPNKEQSIHIIPNLNHFCIINDMTAGLGLLREKDGPGLPPSQCIVKFKDYLKEHGWL